MSLEEEIKRKRQEITIDSYAMSIGEIANLYRDGELEIHPEFQRFYRWGDEQKTKLIESILLGIPIPPIFVAQKTSGVWDVIDGQQRLSTILEFMGLLKDSDGNKLIPLVLEATKFLPSLESVIWNDDNRFNSTQRIEFKREKLNFTIIKEKDNSDQTKYELFQRLNTGGTHLSPQEIRNCILIMINRPLYLLLEELNEYDSFSKCVAISENKANERKDIEMIVRTIIYINLNQDTFDRKDEGKNISKYITEKMEKLAANNEIDKDKFKSNFKRTFDILEKLFGRNAFKKYSNDKFSGAFSDASFEAIVPGIYENISYWEKNEELLKEKVKNLYSEEKFQEATKHGVRPVQRIFQLVNFSRQWFKHED
ncbi:DUF262 domain-containing protein [Pectinatus sottacetonis]|uniref:DUF262 domain-containing protein n=1 Tax=Pectinatus sottacetonis TaxID=1002795 RepID=UPI0018C4CB06|nr:DUF262 domain-containing protein [Pectinatus sottacetonis]